MKTYGIIGLGVMGASFAARLKELGQPVVGFDTDPTVIEYALSHQMIDKGAVDKANDPAAAADVRRLLGLCDVLIFCIYPTLLCQWIEQHQDALMPGTLLMEISGVKRAIMEPAREILREDIELLPIHPMCGRESKGIRYSTPRIFDQANFLIIPYPDSTPQAIVSASVLAKDLGCRNISILSAQEHDAMIAFLSQLTHVIAVSLMNTHENGHLVEYTGDSFRDLTRIARINEEMWSELFLLNKDLLLSEIEQFEASLNTFKTALQNDDSETMKKLFIQSTERREKFG